jgi:predicted lysophospholipase L1 biosynthesis ABC-type transport system permease subunit
MARRFWPDTDSLGQEILIGKGFLPGDVTPRRIVGIVGDIRDAALSREAIPTTYVPMQQMPDAHLALALKVAPLVWIARTVHDAGALKQVLARELEAGSGRPIGRIRTMEEIVSASTARSDLSALLMTGFGLAALLLAAIGIYGVTAYAVEQRAREFGIRLALGATPSQLRGLVLRQGLTVTGLGLVLGVVGAIAATRLLASLLFDVTPREPAVFVTAAAILGAVALGAAWLPAARAMRHDIGAVLRQE